MSPSKKISGWKEGQVDRAGKHFELSYWPDVNADWDNWVLVAVVGPAKAGILSVEFLIDPADPQNADAVREVKNEIQFYFFELKEPDPWLYAQYHCGTCSNAYSNVHWSYFDPAIQDQS